MEALARVTLAMLASDARADDCATLRQFIEQAPRWRQFARVYLVPTPNYSQAAEGTHLCTCGEYPHTPWCGRWTVLADEGSLHPNAVALPAPPSTAKDDAGDAPEPITKAQHNRMMHAAEPYRDCEFCGCHTNAKVRSCCARGYSADFDGQLAPAGMTAKDDEHGEQHG